MYIPKTPILRKKEANSDSSFNNKSYKLKLFNTAADGFRLSSGREQGNGKPRDEEKPIAAQGNEPASDETQDIALPEGKESQNKLVATNQIQEENANRIAVDSLEANSNEHFLLDNLKEVSQPVASSKIVEEIRNINTANNEQIALDSTFSHEVVTTSFIEKIFHSLRLKEQLPSQHVLQHLDPIGSDMICLISSDKQTCQRIETLEQHVLQISSELTYLRKELEGELTNKTKFNLLLRHFAEVDQLLMDLKGNCLKARSLEKKLGQEAKQNAYGWKQNSPEARNSVGKDAELTTALASPRNETKTEVRTAEASGQYINTDCSRQLLFNTLSLREALSEIIGNLSSDNIALTVFLEPNGLYNINISLKLTGQCLACISTNETTFIQALSNKLFENFSLVAVFKSSEIFDNTNNVLDEFFKFVNIKQ